MPTMPKCLTNAAVDVHVVNAQQPMLKWVQVEVDIITLRAVLDDFGV